MVREQRFTQMKTFPCDDEMARRIDEYRWANRISSESEAIRQLIGAGLAAKETPVASEKAPRTRRKPSPSE